MICECNKKKIRTRTIADDTQHYVWQCQGCLRQVGNAIPREQVLKHLIECDIDTREIFINVPKFRAQPSL